MEMDLYERRDELVAERTALIKSMRGVRTLFVAMFADELEKRWDWVARAWLQVFDGRIDQDELAASRREIETLHQRAREIAHAELSGPEVWGHDGSESEVARRRAYAPTSNGRWSHVSPAMESAERKVIEVLERRFGPGPSDLADWEAGALSEELAEILGAYADSFTQLQKVDKALIRVRDKLPRPRPNLVKARLDSE